MTPPPPKKKNMSPSVINKEALHQPIGLIQVLLPCRMRLTKQPFKPQFSCYAVVSMLS